MVLENRTNAATVRTQVGSREANACGKNRKVYKMRLGTTLCYSDGGKRNKGYANMMIAKWIPTEDGGGNILCKTCSNCGYKIISAWYETDFCPVCLAKMERE